MRGVYRTVLIRNKSISAINRWAFLTISHTFSVGSVNGKEADNKTILWVVQYIKTTHNYFPFALGSLLYFYTQGCEHGGMTLKLSFILQFCIPVKDVSLC